MNFLTKSVVVCFVACLIFSVAVLVLNVLGYEISDTLIQYFFLVFGVEFGAAAAIKISAHIIEKDKTEEKLKNLKKEGLPVEKKDITGDEYEEDEYYG